jgi:hypothetical protein
VNKPSRPSPPFAAASPPYELDGYGWAMAQAQLLRERRFDQADIENIVEEIESVGRSEQRAATNNLKVALVHHLKWEYQPDRRGASWARSIREHLRRFDRLIAKNLSLKPRIPDILEEAYLEARYEAGEETELEEDIFPLTPPSWAEIRKERSAAN